MWSGHNVDPSVFVRRVRRLVILPRWGLEGDRDDRAGRTEQAVKEFVEIEVVLTCRTDDAGEDLLGIHSAAGAIPARDLAVTHRRAPELLAVLRRIESRGAPSYSASKAGFSNYLLGMALRLRSHGIAVSDIRFGFVDTKMAKAVRKPLIMTVDRAAGHLLDCLETRPIQLSRPSVAAAGILCARPYVFGGLDRVGPF